MALKESYAPIFDDPFLLLQASKTAIPGAAAASQEEGTSLVSHIAGALPDKLDLLAIRSQLEESDPFAMVALQEAERLNGLVDFLRSNLGQLEAAIAGDAPLTVCGFGGRLTELVEHGAYRDQYNILGTSLS